MTGGMNRNVTLPVLLVFMFGTTAFGEDLLLRGEVIDSEGAVVGGATIRLLAEDTRLTLRRCQAGQDGNFECAAIPKGRYMIATSAPGFRERLLPLGSVSPEVERVQIRLDLLGCDAPGVNCDIFTSGPYSEPHPVRAKGYLHLRPSHAVDLDRGDLKRNSAADIRLEIRDGTRLYLTPLNGARMAQIGAADSNCDRGRYERQPVWIDGLGTGSDICVVTNGRGRSHLFIIGDVSTTAHEVELYYVTRRR